MTNNLKVLKEDLKAFAKKVKGFKYTDSALITFLLTGAISLNGVSAETSIKAQAEALNTSMTNLKDKIKVARQESEKSLKGENMELIQLMEQGDHVVKSPWSSWQYGINGFYNNWRGTYKGRGNKTADVKYKRNNSLEKFKYDSRTHTLYGNTTELGLEREPNAMIPVSASVTPIIPRIKHADISMAVDISDLPSFNPRTVSAPSSPTISPVGTINAPSFSLLAMSAGNYGEDYYDNANATGGGVIDGGVIIKSGNFLAKRTQNDTDGTRGFYDYSYNNYNVKNVFNLNAHLTPPPAVPLPMTSDNPDPLVQPLYRGNGITLNRNLTKTKAKTGFLRMVTDNGWGGPGHEQGGTLVNNGGKFLYTKAFNDPKGYVNEFVHLDMHGGANFTDQKSRLSGELGTTSPEYLAFDDVTAIANKISKSTQGQTFINSGTFVIEGGNVAFSNSYDHAEGDASTVAASVINTSKGNITVHPYTGSEGTYDSNSAVFIVSPSVVGNGNPQILYNAGTVNLYNKKSAVFFLNPNGDFTRNHRNKSDYGGPFDAKLYWSGGYPVPAGHLYDDDEKNPREITIVNRNKINSYGEENVGIYIKTGKYVSSANLDFKTKSSNGDWAPMTMYGDKSIGLYVPIDKTSVEIVLLNPNKASGPVIGNFAVDIGEISGSSKEIYESKTAASFANIDAETTAGTLNKFTINNDKFIDNSYGIFASTAVDFETPTITSKNIENGHQIRLFKNVKNSIGVLTGDSTTIKLGKGKITLNGGFDNTGIIVGGTDTTVAGATSTDGKVTGDVITIDGDSRNDRGNRAIYAGNSANNEVTVNAVVSTNATNSITLVASDKAKIIVNNDTTKSATTIIGNLGEPTNAGVNITNSKFVYDPDRVKSDLNSKDNIGAAYANKDAEITINRTSRPSPANITIKGAKDDFTDKYVGFGLFANNRGTINAQYNSIKVDDASTAVASLNKGNIDLTGAKVEFNGEGYALYTGIDKDSADFTPGVSDTGKINLTTGELALGGKAIGYINDQALTGSNRAITFNNTDISVTSDDVIIADLKNSNGQIVVDVDTPGTNVLKDELLGTGIGNISSSTGINRYKYAVVDNAKINIKKDIDKTIVAATPTSPIPDDDIFTRRFLYQNSIINVDKGVTVKAELDTARLNEIDPDLKTPIGLAVTASANSKDTSTTGINNEGTISADRTDGTDKGGIGLYVDYGFINNKNTGIVNIEKKTGNNPNDKGIGIFGTNSTKVVNDGKVDAKGKKSIGILGLSYRIDSNGKVVDPKDETYYKSVRDAEATRAALSGTSPAYNKLFGYVNIENSADGEVTMADNGAVGLFVKNNSIDQVKIASVYQNVVTNSDDRRDKEDIVGVNKGKITMNGSDSSVGMGANNGTITNAKNSATSTGEIYVNGTKSAGMYGTKNSDLINNGRIDVVATSAGNESIGMFIDDQDSTITNSGTINVGQSSYGIFGKTVKMTGGLIDVADNGVGVYSTGPSVSLSAGTINVADNNAVGVYIADDPDNPQDTNVVSGVDMTVGDTDSFGYLITAKKTKTNLTINPTSNPVHLGEKSVYVYSQAPKSLGGKIVNSSDVITDKNNGYAIYSSQDSENHGYIDLRSGKGNIGIYSTEGIGKNAKDGVIEVGLSDVFTKQFGIGMATGYYNESSKVSSNMGTVENHGTINVANQNSVGMYAVGSGSKAINAKDGVINLSGNNTTGMYIDRGATGENYGTIQTTPTGAGTGIKGVVVTNGGILKNYGTINIVGSKNMGVYVYKGSDGPATYEEHGNKNISTVPVFEGTTTDQKITGKAIVKVPPASLPSPVSISIDGVAVAPTKVDTNIVSPKAPEVLITDLSGVTTLNLAVENMDHEHTHSNAEISELGMYVDTSGINYTNPIRGIENLNGLTSIDLVMGTEVTKYLNAKAIQIGDKILTPYNEAIGNVVRTGVVLNINSSSLTWIAQPVKSNNFFAPIETVYMVKVPYTDFASKNDVDTLHFLDGLEQRYGVEGIHSREKQIFNKLNDLNKSEPHIFAQAVNEMKGYEYSNNQQRINATGNALDKEFRYLWKDWRNPSKQNNKIKVFGMKDEYNTDTAGVIDYDSNAYGVAYVHEDETVKLGNSIGWYAGAVTNRFKFKDLGKSKEEETMIKAGIFKTMSPRKDYNGALRWTIAADVFGGINDMHRKYWVVDDTFDAKSRYYSYGAALKNELGYDIRLSERTHLRPYGALKMEYGRFSNIKEDSGQMKLEVKDNNYFSVKPEAGLEFKYIQPLAVRTKLSVGLTAAYENELGKLNKMNQARVRYTTADWYNLRNEKEDRKGSGKFDLNIGVDNTRFGVTVNAGYDTRGKNVRGGIGFRAIY